MHIEICTQIFIAALFIIAKIRNDITAHQQMNKYINCDVYKYYSDIKRSEVLIYAQFE